MKISDLMIHDPITITPKTTILEALDLMKQNRIRHLPVVTPKGRLRGFVTLADLKQGLIPSMLEDITLADLMIKSPISVRPGDDIEFAAQLIYKYKIGGMPVVKGTHVVGIITESDILRAFIAMMGILTSSSRIEVELDKGTGDVNTATQIIHENGGEIINVVMTTQKTKKKAYYFRLMPCKTRPIKSALQKQGIRVLSATD